MMEEIEVNDGGPAFPVVCIDDHDGATISPGNPGMSLREYFAGQAIQGVIGSVGCKKDETGIIFPNPQLVAMACVDYADALIKELGL